MSRLMMPHRESAILPAKPQSHLPREQGPGERPIPSLPTPPIQIIGLGSPFGADRLGWDAIEHLRRITFINRFPHLQLYLQNCPSPAQLPSMLLPGASLILIDALEGMEQGRIHRLSPEQLQQEPGYASSHGFTLATMLPLIEQLYGDMPIPAIIGIGLGDGAATPLSREAWALLEQRLDEVIRTFAG